MTVIRHNTIRSEVRPPYSTIQSAVKYGRHMALNTICSEGKQKFVLDHDGLVKLKNIVRRHTCTFLISSIESYVDSHVVRIEIHT